MSSQQESKFTTEILCEIQNHQKISINLLHALVSTLYDIHLADSLSKLQNIFFILLTSNWQPFDVIVT